ncbi:MAG TPA: sigma-70 family RNA polymerase sigma factor, partial [Polyangium sp.]|nr:sigma-70 family RNA polymerase sigma factor [Polyangium sp.]
RLQGVHGPDLDDMSQQVWLVAFTHHDKMLASPNTVRGWLSEVARRRARDLRGSPWHCRNVCVETEDLAEMATDPGSRVEAVAILSEVLSRLPERYRDLVRLRALEWETHEIAALHGDAWSTVDYRWRRACAELVGE